MRTYILPHDELHRVVAIDGPLKDIGADPERLKTMSIVVVEVEGQIVAYWVAVYCLHLEPLWINPEYRHNPAVGRGLLETMQGVVEGTGEPAAFCVLQESNRALLEDAAGRLGFLEVPGDRLYYLVLQPAPEPVKG